MDKKSKVILAISFIFATSCKKEEALNSTSNTNWKTSDWMLIKKNINVKGTLCNLYENIKTHQQIYEQVKESRLNYTKQARSTTNGIKCDVKGTNCWTGYVDDDFVIIIKQQDKK